MGSQTIPVRGDGQNIDASWFNIFQSVLIGDLVARNSSAIATDQAGSLGSASVRWLNAYLMKLNLMNGARTLSQLAPAGMLADYTLTWPAALPAAASTMRVSAAGIITFDQMQTADIADGAVTFAKRAALGQQLSSSSSTFTTASATYVDVTNLTCTITTSGRPVFIYLVPDGTNNIAQIGAQNSGGATAQANYQILEGSTSLGEQEIYVNVPGETAANILIPCGGLQWFDTPAAGTYVYKLQAKLVTGTAALCEAIKLLVFEAP